MKQYTQQPSLLALSPLFIFLGVYLVTSLIADDFYKVPITVAFVISSIAAIAMTRHLGLSERIAHFSGGASDKNILLMIWIFILAGAFAQSAKAMGAIDATVNLTHSSGQPAFGRYLYRRLFYFFIGRDLRRNDRSPHSCCCRNRR